MVIGLDRTAQPDTAVAASSGPLASLPAVLLAVVAALGLVAGLRLATRRVGVDG